MLTTPWCSGVPYSLGLFEGKEKQGPFHGVSKIHLLDDLALCMEKAYLLEGVLCLPTHTIFLINLQGGLGIFCKAELGLQSSILDSVMRFLPGLYVSLCRLFFPDFDSEELEKELDILLQDTTKEPSDLPDNPQETFYTNSVPNPRISDAELEAELEKLSLSEGGTELYSQGCWWACGPLAGSSEARG